MIIRSHPSEATLLAYAAGTLAPGPALVVAAHLAFCKDCRQPITTWETAAVGGGSPIGPAMAAAGGSPAGGAATAAEGSPKFSEL